MAACRLELVEEHTAPYRKRYMAEKEHLLSIDRILLNARYGSARSRCQVIITPSDRLLDR